MFGGAGWIATFTNYLLPITMGIITLIPLRKVLCEEKNLEETKKKKIVFIAGGL